MFIVKPVLKTDFTVLPNKLINDENLTPQALSVLVYLLSKPYNWRANVQDIRNHRKGLSRDGAYKALQDLEETGYLVRQRKQTPDGKFTWIRWVYAEPFTGNPGDGKPGDGFPEHGEPETGEPDDGNPVVLVSKDVESTEVESTEVEKTEQLKIISDDPTVDPPKKKRIKNDYTPDFETMWKHYPNGKTKVAAFAAWNATLKDGEDVQEMTTAAINYARVCKKEHRELKHILHCATFFGPREPWKDYLTPPSLTGSRQEIVDPDRSGGGYIDPRSIKRPT